jgi:hypothetical protein
MKNLDIINLREYYSPKFDEGVDVLLEKPKKVYFKEDFTF